MVGEIQKRVVLEDIAIIGGLILVQFVYAGNSVLLSYLMSLRLNPLTIVIFTALSTFLVLSPLSFCFERSKWPKKLSLKLLVQLVLIAIGGVTLFQSLYLKGIKLTSPAMATAMPNLAPGLIFVIAAVFRLEKVKLSCMYSRVKIVGTLMCVTGAVTMSIMQSTMHDDPTAEDSQLQLSLPETGNLFNIQKIIGCLYLMAAVLALSSNIVLQAVTLSDFPAPISLCAITSLIGVVITSMVELIQDHHFDIGWPIVSVRDIIGFSLLGGIVSGGCFSFNGWAMKKRGPVLVAMFSPVATVVSVILSFLTTGEYITLGSVFGMVLMFTGLYFFLWAKRKEDFTVRVRDGDKDGDGSESECDMEKHLLS
ncbi:WAT1-related protein At5g47470 isoform X1 [Rhododendron vialii]|uniref:WAT1-related protein At5g47470 isoform X1 n=1 Tax=Rhododendron vialii TaxID=182163 RepID=UPI00265F6EE6|nr:WAT1-related protein At5g47470 isoform X1 [Rhododendron vialii]